jgi:hypothetical protein
MTNSENINMDRCAEAAIMGENLENFQWIYLKNPNINMHLCTLMANDNKNSEIFQWIHKIAPNIIMVNSGYIREKLSLLLGKVAMYNFNILYTI